MATKKNDFPFGNRWRACGTSSATHGYLALGKISSLIFPKGFYEYDPQTDSWSGLPDFPLPGRSHARMIFFDNDLLLLAGIDSLGDSHNDMWRYDLQGAGWDQLVSIPAAGRRGGVCFASATYLYYSTGIDQANVRLKETWKNVNPTSLPGNFNTTNFVVYPNPADDHITLSWSSTEPLQIKAVLVYDVAAHEVLNLQSPFESPQIIDISGLQPGWYNVIVVMSSGVVMRNITVR